MLSFVSKECIIKITTLAKTENIREQKREMRFSFLLLLLLPLVLGNEIEGISVPQDEVPISQENAGVAAEINVDKIASDTKSEDVSIETFKSQSVRIILGNFYSLHTILG